MDVGLDAIPVAFANIGVLAGLRIDVVLGVVDCDMGVIRAFNLSNMLVRFPAVRNDLGFWANVFRDELFQRVSFTVLDRMLEQDDGLEQSFSTRTLTVIAKKRPPRLTPFSSRTSIPPNTHLVLTR